jgi:fucose permease
MLASRMSGSIATKRARRLGLLACHGSMMTLAISLNLLPVCLPLMRQGIGNGGVLTNEQLGRIAAMAFVGMVAGLLLSGPAACRIRARWFTVGGNLVIVAGLLALAFADSFQGVLVAATLMGLGGGLLDMILSPIVCALVPERRAQAMNWLHSFYCVGAVLIVLGATVAFARSWSWHQVAFAMAAPPAAFAATFAFVPHPDLKLAAGSHSGLRELVGHRYFLLSFAAIFLSGATEMGIAQWLPAYAELELGFSRWIGGSALLAFSVAMAAGRMGVGVISGRVPIRKIMAWSSAATAVLILLAGLFPVAGVALAAAVASGAAMSCLWPSTLGIAADRFPSAGTSLFGVLAAAGNCGGVFMPWAIGIIGDSSSLALGVSASAACPVLILLTLRAMGRVRGAVVDRAVA